MAFKKATAKQGKVRMALVGGPGTGKTWTALVFATALAGADGSIAFVDTEHGSASKYASEEEGDGLFDFDVEEPATFDPHQLLGFISDAARENYKVLVVDSYSHYWSGQDGILEIVGGNFNRWKDVTPTERKVISALLTFPGHVIICMRAKTDYVKIQGRNGKEQMQKVGVKPDQREAIEFEFDVVAYMSREGTGVAMSVEKTRCPALQGEVFTNPTATTLEPLQQWLSRGTPSDDDYWSKRIAEASDQDTLVAIYHDLQEQGIFSKWKMRMSARKDEIKRAETATQQTAEGTGPASSPPVASDEEWAAQGEAIMDADPKAVNAFEAKAKAAGKLDLVAPFIKARREELQLT